MSVKEIDFVVKSLVTQKNQGLNCFTENDTKHSRKRENDPTQILLEHTEMGILSNSLSDVSSTPIPRADNDNTRKNQKGQTNFLHEHRCKNLKRFGKWNPKINKTVTYNNQQQFILRIQGQVKI